MNTRNWVREEESFDKQGARSGRLTIYWEVDDEVPNLISDYKAAGPIIPL